MPVGGGSTGGASAGAVRAGRAFVELFADDSRLVRALSKARDRLAGFGRTIAGVSFKGLIGGAAGLTPLVALNDTLGDLAKQGAAAKAFGLTAEQFTGIAGVAKAAGEDTREFIESLVTLGKVASEGAMGKGEVAPQFFKDINLNAKEFAALRPDEQFFKFFEAVRAVEDPLARLRLLMNAFGEDGGKQLLPLLSKGQGELRALAAEFSVSGDTIEQATAAQLQYSLATSRLQRAWEQAAVAVAPAIGAISAALSPFLLGLRDILQANPRIVTGFFAVAAGVAAAGVAGLALSGVFTGLGAVFAVGAVALKAIAAALATILSPAGLVTAAVAGIGYALATQTEDGRTATAALATAFTDMGAAFQQAWGGILDAIKAGDLGLALKVAGAGLTVVWLTALEKLVEGWQWFQRTVLDSLASLTDRIAKFFVNIGSFGVLIAQGSDAADRFEADLKGQIDELRRGVNDANAEARRGQLERARADLDAAKRDLGGLVQQARIAADAARRPNPGEVSNSGGLARALALPSAVRGAFGTNGAAASIFGGQSGIGGKMLDQQKITNRKLDEIKRGLGGLAGGLAFS